MATKLELNHVLLNRVAMSRGKPSIKSAVTLPPQKLLTRCEQKRIAELFGELAWDASYAYKAERSRD
ncbi:MAG: type II toxin-antitoxin system VapB family antitoxin [Burkholderiales bacterium]|nr:MAG: type II toxin-antitoxin system VapB family antitoxin [Burkholderiales bacterium]